MIALILPLQNSLEPVHNLNAKNDFESELVIGLKAGERKSIALLYKCYSGALLGIIMKIVKADEIAEDVLQDTFVKIWKSIHQYDPGRGRIFTWMARIAKNTALDQVRSRSQQDAALNNDIGLVAVEVNKSHQISYNPETIGVKKLTDFLTPDQKLILDLIYFEGYTQSEVAEELKIPIGTVKTRTRIAIKSLRKFF